MEKAEKEAQEKAEKAVKATEERLTKLITQMLEAEKLSMLSDANFREEPVGYICV